MTQSKYDSLEQELVAVTQQRETAVEELSLARAMGDLSENGRYKAARQNLNQIDSKLKRIKHWIKYAAIIKKSNSHRVELGSYVKVEINGQIKAFTIVGHLEADPGQNRISDSSPIGHVLMGRQSGEAVSAKTPSGILQIIIKDIC